MEISTDTAQTDTQTTEAPQTGTPLTLDAALLRIAELESEKRVREAAAIKARIREVAKDLANEATDVILDHLTDQLDEALTEEANKLPPGTDVLQWASDAAGMVFSAFGELMGTEVIANHVPDFIADELPQALARAAEDRAEEERPPQAPTPRAILGGALRHSGLIGGLASLGYRIADATAGIPLQPGTPNAEIATEKTRLAHALLKLAQEVDSARAEDLPALLAGAFSD